LKTAVRHSATKLADKSVAGNEKIVIELNLSILLRVETIISLTTCFSWWQEKEKRKETVETFMV
jgi:hypothetical protein